jgi:hypothetical protein
MPEDAPVMTTVEDDFWFMGDSTGRNERARRGR